MDLDMEEMFGRNSASRRGSDASDSGGGSGSEDDDDGGRNNLMEEALEVPDPESGGGQQTDAAKPIKPKRVVKNPMPKLDAIRIAGPRGIPVLQKCFKNVKFHGKGYEKEDLDIVLKHLEHWAHRMYPKLPFKDTLEQLEKLGAKKPVQVMMKRIRLDMFFEGEMEGRDEDDVRRGIDDEETTEPVVDVFDELLGQADFPSVTPSSHTQSGGLTDEQRDRLERNRRLAEERRLARLKEQEEHERLLEEMDDGHHLTDTNSLPTNIISDTSETRQMQTENVNSGLENEDVNSGLENENINSRFENEDVNSGLENDVNSRLENEDVNSELENEDEAMEYEEISSTKANGGNSKDNRILKRVFSSEQVNNNDIVNGDNDCERKDNENENVNDDNAGINLEKDAINYHPQSSANNNFSKENECELKSEDNDKGFKEDRPESLENSIDKENNTVKSSPHILLSPERSGVTQNYNVVFNKVDENETGKSNEETLFTEDDVLGMLED